MRTAKTFAAFSGIGFVMAIVTAPGCFMYFGWESVVCLMMWAAASYVVASLVALPTWASAALGLFLLALAYGLAFGAYHTVDEGRLRRFR